MSDRNALQNLSNNDRSISQKKQASKASSCSFVDRLAEEGGADEHIDTWISTGEAKHEYFLNASDLRGLYHKSWGGGIGCGPPMKLYHRDHLFQEAISKHGRTGLEKKLQARHKRETNKALKEAKAQAKLEEAKKKHLATDDAPDTNAIQKLRMSLLKMTKKHMGFEMSGSPKKWRVEVPAVQAETFAALMGRPSDGQLETFCKKGAYYSESYSAEKLFGTDSSDEDALTRYFSREGVAQRIGDTVTVRFKPCADELSITGWAEIAY